jgi:hypothetical protein
MAIFSVVAAGMGRFLPERRDCPPRFAAASLDPRTPIVNNLVSQIV